MGAIYEMLGSAKRDGPQTPDATSDESPNIRVDRIFELLDQVSEARNFLLISRTRAQPIILIYATRTGIISCRCKSSRKGPNRIPRLSRRSLFTRPEVAKSLGARKNLSASIN